MSDSERYTRRNKKIADVAGRSGVNINEALHARAQQASATSETAIRRIMRAGRTSNFQRIQKIEDNFVSLQQNKQMASKDISPSSIDFDAATFEDVVAMLRRGAQVVGVVGAGSVLAACNLVAVDKQAKSVAIVPTNTDTPPTHVMTATLVPTQYDSPTPSATASETQIPTQTNTLTATNTEMPSSTPVPPSATASETASSTPDQNATAAAIATKQAVVDIVLTNASSVATVEALETQLAPVTPTLESFPTGTLTPTEAQESYFHILPDTGLTISQENGTVSIDMGKFRGYFGASLDKQGKDDAGNIVDFTANMFGTPMTGELTFDKSSNWWLNRKEGLGWTSADPIYESLEELSTVAAVNSSLVFEERGKVFRFGVRVDSHNFEKAYATAAVYRYLVGAGMASKTKEEIETYLADPTVDANIKNLWRTLLSQSGYQPVAGEKQEDPLQSWPGAGKVFNNEMPNMVSDNGTSCETNLIKAEDRDAQREVTHDLDIKVELEKTSAKNDETMNRMDADSQVLVMVTFDSRPNANPGLSPNGKGKMRIDIITARDYADSLSGHTPAKDQEVLLIEPANFGRLLNCGAGNAIIATPEYVATLTPAGITIYETPRPVDTSVPGQTQLPPTGVPPTAEVYPTLAATNIAPPTVTPVSGEPTEQTHNEEFTPTPGSTVQRTEQAAPTVEAGF